jgi:two-component system sensor histidine kinase KdpD
LIAVVLLASRQGWRASFAAAVTSVLASDFLLVPPYFSFAVARPQDLLTLAIFIWAALVVSHWTADLRRASQRAQAREHRLRALYDILQTLSKVEDVDAAVSAVCVALCPDSHWQTAWLTGGSGQPWLLAQGLRPLLGTGAASAGNGTPAPTLAQTHTPWRADDLDAVRAEATPVFQARSWLVPVAGHGASGGILGWYCPEGLPILDAEQRAWLLAATSLLAQTLDRLHAAQSAQDARVQARAELTRNAMLSAIAHDFRTPLAAITAASSTLVADRDRLTSAQQLELQQAILTESKRLSHLAESTLDMARLGAGPIPVHREWYPVEEVVGAVVYRLNHALDGRALDTQLPPGLALMHVDEALVVRVLENLLGNAIKFSPPSAPLHLRIEQADRETRFTLRDHGPGLMPGEEQRIFERFVRGSAGESQPGAGLGLTICQMIVHAHGGRIWAQNHADGGAEFAFTIPALEDPPSLNEPIAHPLESPT